MHTPTPSTPSRPTCAGVSPRSTATTTPTATCSRWCSLSTSSRRRRDRPPGRCGCQGRGVPRRGLPAAESSRGQRGGQRGARRARAALPRGQRGRRRPSVSWCSPPSSTTCRPRRVWPRPSTTRPVDPLGTPGPLRRVLRAGARRVRRGARRTPQGALRCSSRSCAATTSTPPAMPGGPGGSGPNLGRERRAWRPEQRRGQRPPEGLATERLELLQPDPPVVDDVVLRCGQGWPHGGDTSAEHLQATPSRGHLPGVSGRNRS